MNSFVRVHVLWFHGEQGEQPVVVRLTQEEVMLTRQIVRFSAVAIVGIMCAVATEARADENGIPIALPASALTAPLSCLAPLGDGNSVTIAAVPMGSPATFPRDVPCPGEIGTTCSEYNYKFTSSNGSTLLKSFLTVSSDVVIYEASPSGSALFNECIADRAPTNGLTACAQREVKFLSHASPLDAKVVVSRAAPHVSTAGSLVGFRSGFCLIQGPGVTGGTFNTVATGDSEIVAGGKCVANLVRGPGGSVAGAIADPNCGFAEILTENFKINGLPVRGANGKPITYGDTTTCYIQTNGKTSCYCKNPSTPCPN